MSREAGDAVYEFDPDAAPDSAFAPGELAHLALGNSGRLLDARRTPVDVMRVDVATGMFEVRVEAFEDADARWRVPFEEAGRFQFARSARPAAPDDLAGYREAVARFDRRMSVERPAAADATWARVARERAGVAARLTAAGVAPRLSPEACIARGEGDPSVIEAVRSVLAERALDAMDDAFATTHVSNPWSGEMVKGHAIVAAELGLSPYRGKIVRDARLFSGEWSKERRAQHLVVRLALSAELWSRSGRRDVALYRATATEGAPTLHDRPAFVSCTFSRAVAEAHFAGMPSTRAAVLSRQLVPVERLLMTFWETAAMNRRYREAEAVVIGLPELRI